MSGGFPKTITIGSVTHPVTVPDYSTCHDIGVNSQTGADRISFVMAAVVNLCCGLVKVKNGYDGDSRNLWRYGRKVYNLIRPDNEDADIVKAGYELMIAAIQSRMPAQDEVERRSVFSMAQAPPTMSR